jgi:hypothetical protein
MGPLIVDYEAAMPTAGGGEMADDLKGMKVAILATDGVAAIGHGPWTLIEAASIVAQFAKASVPG